MNVRQVKSVVKSNEVVQNNVPQPLVISAHHSSNGRTRLEGTTGDLAAAAEVDGPPVAADAKRNRCLASSGTETAGVGFSFDCLDLTLGVLDLLPRLLEADGVFPMLA